MASPLSLGDVLRRFGSRLTQARGGLPSAQVTVLSQLMRCHTAALGGHVYACVDCGHELVAYNGCGNRHCPVRSFCSSSGGHRFGGFAQSVG